MLASLRHAALARGLNPNPNPNPNNPNPNWLEGASWTSGGSAVSLRIPAAPGWLLPHQVLTLTLTPNPNPSPGPSPALTLLTYPYLSPSSENSHNAYLLLFLFFLGGLWRSTASGGVFRASGAPYSPEATDTGGRTGWYKGERGGRENKWRMENYAYGVGGEGR